MRKSRPDITIITVETVDKFPTRMYQTHSDFVFCGHARVLVRNCRTAVLTLPDDVPAHRYVVADRAAGAGSAACR